MPLTESLYMENLKAIHDVAQRIGAERERRPRVGKGCRWCRYMPTCATASEVLTP